jgi:hypothetical protein
VFPEIPDGVDDFDDVTIGILLESLSSPDNITMEIDCGDQIERLLEVLFADAIQGQQMGLDSADKHLSGHKRYSQQLLHLITFIVDERFQCIGIARLFCLLEPLQAACNLNFDRSVNPFEDRIRRFDTKEVWFVELFVVDFEAIFVVGCGRADTSDDVSD